MELISRGNKPRPLPNKTFAGGIVLLFLVAGMIVAMRHELWRDEMRAWLIARDAPSLAALPGLLKYEGHPGLWYFFLYGLSRVTRSPFIMQVFHLGLAGFSLYLFCRFSPFSRFQKALFAFGYFPFFEYGILARDYAMGILLLFLCCSLYPRRKEKFLYLALLLFLAAHTNVYTLILVISLGGALALEILMGRDARNKARNAVGLLLIGLGVLTAVIQLQPPPDLDLDRQAYAWNTGFHADLFLNVLRLIPRSFLPVPEFSLHFWNTNILDHPPFSSPIRLLGALSILFYAFLLLLGTPTAFFFFLFSFIGISAFTYMINFSYVYRHQGFYFISFVMAAWLAGQSRELKNIPPVLSRSLHAVRNHFSRLFSIVLLIHLMSGLYAVMMDLQYPFSNGERVARYIRERKMDALPLVGDDIDPVTGYLESKAYLSTDDALSSYVLRKKKKNGFRPAYLILRQATILSLKGAEDCIIVSRKLWGHKVLGLAPEVRILKKFESSITAEDFYLYLVSYDLLRHKAL